MTGRTVFSEGRFLESACKSYAYRESMRVVRCECRTCGGSVECRAGAAQPGKGGVIRVYCGPGCQSEGVAADENERD